MQTQVRHACRALVSTTNRRTSWSPPNARESNLSEASSAPMPAIKLTRASSQYPAVRTCHGRVMVCPGTSKKTACKSGNMRSSRWTNNSPPARARGGVSVDSMMISLRAEPPQSATAAGAVCRERGVLTGAKPTVVASGAFIAVIRPVLAPQRPGHHARRRAPIGLRCRIWRRTANTRTAARLQPQREEVQVSDTALQMGDVLVLVVRVRGQVARTGAESGVPRLVRNSGLPLRSAPRAAAQAMAHRS